MTKAEYDVCRKIPERVRATRNGKRSLDAFTRSIRERIAVEQPEYLKQFDTDINYKLNMLYFYFTKYITARFNTKGLAVYCVTADGDNIYKSDNLLSEVEK